METLNFTIWDFVCSIMERKLTNKSEIYEYIKKKTGNFDSMQTLLFKQDMRRNYDLFLAEKETYYENNISKTIPLEEWLRNSFDHFSFWQAMGMFINERRKIAANMERLKNWEEQAEHTNNIEPQKEPSTQRAKAAFKPQKEPSTQRAKAAFKLAEELGFMEKIGNGYKWIYLLNKRGNKSSLAYFLVETYNHNGEGITHFTKLNKLFGVKRLDSTADKVYLAKKKQPWRKEIDNLLSKISNIK